MSWLTTELGLTDPESEIIRERMADCRTCGHYRHGFCRLFRGVDRLAQHARHLLAGACQWHTETGDIYRPCRSCANQRPDGRCVKFIAGCDADERRRATLRGDDCRYYRKREELAVAKYRGPDIPPDRFITTARLADYTLEFSKRIQLWQFRSVIGVARSGIIPATILATAWHLPLWSTSPTRGGLIYVGNGHRLGNPATRIETPALVVDDTACGGWTMRSVKSQLSRYLDTRQLATAVVFATPEAANSPDGPDFVGWLYSRPHYLEWCFANTAYAQHLAFDFDGILCDDPTTPDDDPLYLGHLESAPPKYLPRMWPATILTARCERYRGVTEDWLARHRISVRRLIMWDGEPDARWIGDAVAAWKADQLKKLRQELGIIAYAESDPRIAAAVAMLADMPVICPAAERVFGFHRWE